MHSATGVQFIQLLMGAADTMVDEARAELVRAGHPNLTVGNEFAMRAIAGGANSAADLARALGVSRQAAAKTIASLENSGYVDRTSNTTDARQKHLSITEHGREAIATGAAAFESTYRRWLQAVGEDQATIVLTALRTLEHGSN